MSMDIPVGGSDALTDALLRQYAESAALEGESLGSFFNSIQSRAEVILAPESRIFAEVWYEKKLVQCVAAALVVCAKSEEGKQRTIEILHSEAITDLHTRWKPLVEKCSWLLIALKMESTDAHLGLLSDIWSKSEEGERQAARLMEVVRNALEDSDQKSNDVLETIFDWVELCSIPYSEQKLSARDLTRSVLVKKRSLKVVETFETFAEAENFINREVRTSKIVHVIVGNEDDGARFYTRIFHRCCGFNAHGVQLIWRLKTYGQRSNPMIIIGSLDYFISKGWRDQTEISAVILHAERKLNEYAQYHFEQEILDDFLAELYVLTTITMEHVDEMKEVIDNVVGLCKLMNSWPNEYQIINSRDVLSIMSDCHSKYGESTEFKDNFMNMHLRLYIEQALENEVDVYILTIPQRLRGYVKSHRAQFIRTALVARCAELGHDYIAYSERRSSSISLKIRLKAHIADEFGLQQFIELRHGCETTPYRVPGWNPALDHLQNYKCVQILTRNNYFRDHNVLARRLNVRAGDVLVQSHNIGQNMTRMDLTTPIPSTVNLCAKRYMRYVCLIVAVCPSDKTLACTFSYLKSNGNAKVVVCETAFGVFNESAKIPQSDTLIVCTTTVCFEGWQFLPRTRNHLQIIICGQKADTAAMEVAHDLAHSWEIMRCIVENEERSIFERYAPPLNSTDEAVLTLREAFPTQPEMFIEQYKSSGDIHDLINAKKTCHNMQRKISVIAKFVHAGLPVEKAETTDSPMDLASEAFVKKSRKRIEDITVIRREVERMLIYHAKTIGLGKMEIDTRDVLNIEKRYKIDITSFVTRMRNKVASWRDINDNVKREFALVDDAEYHWYNVIRIAGSTLCTLCLNDDCKSTAIFKKYKEKLVPLPLPEKYRESIFQCSDRNLENCSMYLVESALVDTRELLALKGASLECLAEVLIETQIVAPQNGRSLRSPCILPVKNVSNFEYLYLTGSFLDRILIRTAILWCPLYLFPRRCYDRLTRDLFESGLLICEDYEAAGKEMNPRDVVQ